MAKEIHQQWIQLDAIVRMRALRKGQDFLDGWGAAVKDRLNQAPIDAHAAHRRVAQ
jgi:hypothetical protein